MPQYRSRGAHVERVLGAGSDSAPPVVARRVRPSGTPCYAGESATYAALIRVFYIPLRGIIALSDPVNTPGQSTPNPKPGHHIEDEEYAVDTTTSHPATATETVRKAIETAEKKLSSTMREATRHAAKNHEGRWVVVGRRDTLAALESRGMVAGYLSRRVAELNDFGRVVHVVIVKGADAVLAWAEQKDAERAD
jgi:hypothetical protein